MKKCKSLLFLVVCFLSFILSPKAATLTTDYQINFYSNRSIDKVNYSGPLAYMRIDGNIVYCLNPELIVGSNYVTDQSILNQYSKEQIEHMQLIAYYGYNDINNTLEYYAATQQLIWEYLDVGQNHFYWSTERNSSGDIILINNELKEIRDKVDSFYNGISFKNEVITGYIGDEIILYDSNEVLYDYIIEGDSDNYMWIEGNSLHIKIQSTNKEQIKFKRKITNLIDTETYSSAGHQNLIRFGIDATDENVITIEGKELLVQEEINPEIPENSNPDISDEQVQEEPKEEIKIELKDDVQEEIIEETEDKILEEKEISEEEILTNKEILLEKTKEEEIINVEDNYSSIVEELPNTYNNESKFYYYIVTTFLLGMSVYYKYL